MDSFVTLHLVEIQEPYNLYTFGSQAREARKQEMYQLNKALNESTPILEGTRGEATMSVELAAKSSQSPLLEYQARLVENSNAAGAAASNGNAALAASRRTA